jgi:hypothetical protein
MSDHSFPWGTTFPFDITVTLSGSAVNLTGKKLILKAKYRKTDADAAAVIAMSTEAGEGIEVTNAAGGIARATITPAMVAALPAGRETRLHYAVRLIDGANVYDLEEGTFSITPVVVRATS